MAKTKNTYLISLLAKRLEEIRTQQDLSLTEFAKACNVDYAAYSRLERGDGCSLVNLLQILNHLCDEEYNLNWLIKEDNFSEDMKENDMFFLSFDRKSVLKQLTAVEETIGEVKDKLKNS